METPNTIYLGQSGTTDADISVQQSNYIAPYDYFAENEIPEFGFHPTIDNNPHIGHLLLVSHRKKKIYDELGSSSTTNITDLDHHQLLLQIIYIIFIPFPN